MEAIFIHPLFAVLAGWFAWNVLMFRLEKDEYDKRKEAFPLAEYVSLTWDNWLASLVFIPVLLFLGYKGLGLNPFTEHPVAWTDFFYLCSGFAPEFVLYLYSKWKNK